MAAIHSCENMTVMARKVAEHMVQSAVKATAQHGLFRLVLAGGQTPGALYALLASADWREQMPWSKTVVFWGDERLVAANDPASNFALARPLLDRVRPARVFPMAAISEDHEAAAVQYEQIIRQYATVPGEGTLFDLVLLGMGNDGHTASLFPGSEKGVKSSLEYFPQIGVLTIHDKAASNSIPRRMVLCVVSSSQPLVPA